MVQPETVPATQLAHMAQVHGRDRDLNRVSILETENLSQFHVGDDLQAVTGPSLPIVEVDLFAVEAGGAIPDGVLPAI